MSRLDSLLEKSRIADVIERVERGEPVDYRRLLTLQSLDIVRAGELFTLEAIQAERAADEAMEKAIRDATQ